ncbi:MAG TPA: flagellar basal body-associated FliL family protein [Nevskiaceae bacterium]|nr:flagellar basal body-associated FliL family protein [Nevskiaceae bacterium]
MAAAPAASAPAAPVADAAAAKPRGGGLGLMLLGVVLSAAASGGAALYFQRAAPAAEAEALAEAPAAKLEPAQYLPLTPAFVVNLEDPQAMRFLQLDVEVMARDPAVIEAIKLHQPRIRNALLLLFGQQDPDQLATRTGKEALQAQALNEVRTILEAEQAAAGIEGLFFTSFVMQ